MTFDNATSVGFSRPALTTMPMDTKKCPFMLWLATVRLCKSILCRRPSQTLKSCSNESAMPQPQHAPKHPSQEDTRDKHSRCIDSQSPTVPARSDHKEVIVSKPVCIFSIQKPLSCQFNISDDEVVYESDYYESDCTDFAESNFSNSVSQINQTSESDSNCFEDYSRSSNPVVATAALNDGIIRDIDQRYKTKPHSSFPDSNREHVPTKARSHCKRKASVKQWVAKLGATLQGTGRQGNLQLKDTTKSHHSAKQRAKPLPEVHEFLECERMTYSDFTKTECEKQNVRKLQQNDTSESHHSVKQQTKPLPEVCEFSELENMTYSDFTETEDEMQNVRKSSSRSRDSKWRAPSLSSVKRKIRALRSKAGKMSVKFRSLIL